MPRLGEPAAERIAPPLDRPLGARWRRPLLRLRHGRARPRRLVWQHADVRTRRRSRDAPSRTTPRKLDAEARRSRQARSRDRPRCGARPCGQPADQRRPPGRSCPPEPHRDRRDCRCLPPAWPRHTTRQIAHPNSVPGCPPLQRLGLPARTGPERRRRCRPRRRLPTWSGFLSKDCQALRSQVPGPQRPARSQHKPGIAGGDQDGSVVRIDDLGTRDLVGELA